METPAVEPPAVRPPPPPRPVHLRWLLALSMLVSGLSLAQSVVGIVRTAGQPRVSWFSGPYDGLEYAIALLFQGLLPALLAAGVVGVWMRKPGARRLTVLVAGGMILVACVAQAVGFAALFTKPPRLLEWAQALINVAQSLLSGYGVLFLLVIALRQPLDNAPASAPTTV